MLPLTSFRILSALNHITPTNSSEKRFGAVEKREQASGTGKSNDESDDSLCKQLIGSVLDESVLLDSESE